MDIKKHEWSYVQHPDIPAVVVDNWYTPKELELVWKQLDFFTQKNAMERAEASSSVARKPETNEAKGRNARIWLDNYFTRDGNMYNIISNSLAYKLNKSFISLLSNCSEQFRNFVTTNTNTSFVSYYENNDEYDYHFDLSMFTMLIWLYKTPKKFKGGDFCFRKKDRKIELKNNRMLLFPSYLEHKVTKLFMKNSKKNNGRYTITHFFNYNTAI